MVDITPLNFWVRINVSLGICFKSQLLVHDTIYSNLLCFYPVGSLTRTTLKQQSNYSKLRVFYIVKHVQGLTAAARNKTWNLLLFYVRN